jgi:hypothetical protein
MKIRLVHVYNHVLLHVQVALGNMHELTRSNSNLPRGLPPDRHSVKGVGKSQPDPKVGTL